MRIMRTDALLTSDLVVIIWMTDLGLSGRAIWCSAGQVNLQIIGPNDLYKLIGHLRQHSSASAC
ncbi:MAG: hypothetical protein EBW32_03515 [Rhodobacteraceae bacterium]|nr:hypothetical protein [Paracoccaceae bacterium]